ncbi:DUF4326 domain-containing protein [Labrys wisconsinensis]|uniref:DUF4326 domain-containing protein n=1 Tax=Labrys wisconsinensis TaxID=425677 RepID=A0ABU0JES6_9HYPH|nr:DUF4326 domain-containing protein [Labrys wisconsinensis]MDQ0472774.1 hypothetical protein [Labrys wisconsinensis]
MTGPARIRLSRRKGWRMPAMTCKVDRSSPLGNPFVVGWDGTAAECVDQYKWVLGGHVVLTCKATIEAQMGARRNVVASLPGLRGLNLACWCRLCDAHKAGKPFDVDCSDCAPCHADVLGRTANRPLCEPVGGSNA